MKYAHRSTAKFCERQWEKFWWSEHLIQCTGTDPDDKDCAAWTSMWLPKRLPRNFIDCPFLRSFCAASGCEECKKSQPSNGADIKSLFCADSIEQWGWRNNIRICVVEEINDKDVHGRVAEAANEIRVTKSKQDIRVFHRLPSRNTGSRSVFAEFVRCETKFRVLTHEKKLKISSRKISFKDDVILLRANIARALGRRPDLKYDKLFNRKVVLTMSNDERHIINNFFDLPKRDMEFFQSVCDNLRHIR